MYKLSLKIYSSILKDLVTNYYMDMSTLMMVENNALNRFCYKDVKFSYR